MLTSKPALFKLRKEVRSAIKTLTVAEEATIEADSVVAGEDLQLTLTREDLERECADVAQAVPLLLQALLEETGAACPAEVFIVGGSMRIPFIQKGLQAFLDQHGAVIRKTVDMDRGVSLGTASVAAVLVDPSALRMPLLRGTPFKETAERAHVKVGADGALLSSHRTRSIQRERERARARERERERESERERKRETRGATVLPRYQVSFSLACPLSLSGLFFFPVLPPRSLLF